MNHLGPYSQEGVWQISGAHLSGEASGEFEVDLNGLVTGNALAFTWSNEFRPLSWGLVNVVGAQGGAGWNYYTYDGIYQAYLAPGTYQFTISAQVCVSILVRRRFGGHERTRTKPLPRTVEYSGTRVQRPSSSSNLSARGITLHHTKKTQVTLRNEREKRSPIFLLRGRHYTTQFRGLCHPSRPTV